MGAPVTNGDELELRIDSLAYGGNGVARLDGFVVFVKRGLPGDLVRARVTKVKRSHAEAEALEVVEPGAPRVDAPCLHFPTCGGCRYQDLAYEAQLEAKASQVADALARIGGMRDLELEPAVPAESIFHYRNKLEYSFTSTPGGAGLGFHRAGRWDEVLDIEKCWLTTDLGNAIRDAARAWARAEGLQPFDQETQRGYLRHLVVREGRNTGQALVTLVTAPGELESRDRFVVGAAAVPRGEVGPLGRERPARRGDEPADRAALGRAVDRGGDPREPLPRAAERVPPNQYGDGRAAVRPGARVRGAHRHRDRLRPLLRDRDDRDLARRGRADGVGGGDLRGVGRVRARERRAERRRRTPRSSPATPPIRSRSCASAPASRTWSCSTLRAPVSPGRRYGGSAASRRRRSSTSRATRRRSRETRRSSSPSSATSSTEYGLWTCSRTRRTSRRSRSSPARSPAAATPASAEFGAATP